MGMGEDGIGTARQTLHSAGHGEAAFEGHGAYLPVFSDGFWLRPSVDGRDVEVLHLGAERDDVLHEGWLERYSKTLAVAGTVGRRRLGAGRGCVTFVPAPA